jgi:hypothetical protein
MQKKPRGDASVARVSAAVAVVSLLLNAIQFYSGSRDQERRRQQEEADRGPKAFYAYANDPTLVRLYAHEIPALSVRHGSEPDSQIRRWLVQARRPGATMRERPTASFLVVGTRQDNDVPNVAAVVRHGPSEPDTVLLSPSLLVAKEFVLVPLDFRQPGNDFAEPGTPRETLVEYGDKQTLTVRPTDIIDWLGGQFFRGLVRSGNPESGIN